MSIGQSVGISSIAMVLNIFWKDNWNPLNRLNGRGSGSQMFLESETLRGEWRVRECHSPRALPPGKSVLIHPRLTRWISEQLLCIFYLKAAWLDSGLAFTHFPAIVLILTENEACNWRTSATACSGCACGLVLESMSCLVDFGEGGG